MTREPAALIWPEAELRQALLAWDPFQAPPRTPLPEPEPYVWDEALEEAMAVLADRFDGETP